MLVTGKITKKELTSYGYTSLTVNGKRYGADAKGEVSHSEGETVSFEAFQKPGKDGRLWDTYQVRTLKAIIAAAAASAAPTPSSSAPAKSQYQQKEDYWSSKATEYKAKDPRIAYFAASERAIAFVDLAIRVGAFAALEKAKPVDKLGILEAFTNEQTTRIMAASYAAKVSAVTATAAAEAEPQLESDLPEASDENWS